jgi:CDGSH-type Zn-finger protein
VSHTLVSITIRLKRNGPYVIAVEEADQVTILDVDGTALVPEPGRSITLCRCGGSSTKPFCDRTHRSNGFDGTCSRASAEPADKPTVPAQDPTPPTA